MTDLRTARLKGLGQFLATPETRRALTKRRPDLFALIYFPRHLRDKETGRITFAEVHDEWCDLALSWADGLGGLMENRDAFIAPRETGKSTWWFLILPMWAAAHGYVQFAAAFADSATQAESHLKTFRVELDTNALLRQDFPDLCSPARRPRGVSLADSAGMMIQKNGFVFAARGIDASNLGMKVGDLRPDLLILDDVEPGEANYSGYQMGKRLKTVRDVVFPMNLRARVVLVGTVTMPGSIMHQLVRDAAGEHDDPDLKWITEENFTVHHAKPILVNDDGTERSLWPDRWPLEWLNSITGTRLWRMNFANDPLGYDGAYWSESDFRYGDLEAITKRILSVDPSVTTKTSSDPTGLAVVGFSPSQKKAVVEKSVSVRLTGSPLRDYCLRLIEAGELEGRPIRGVLIETNQGGDLWQKEVFRNFPVPVKTVHQSVKKEIRAGEALSHYQRGRVLHLTQLRSLEEQMVAFPAAAHDDEVDATGAAVNFFLSPEPKKKAGVRSTSYV